MLQQKTLLLLISLVVLYACSIENAKAPSVKELVIASDYLNESDTVLFEDFIRENKVELRILHMDTRMIQQRLTEREANSGVDIVMVKSIYHVHKLQRKGVFHAINFADDFSEDQLKFASWKYHYIGVGIDPYGLAIQNSGTNRHNTYNDLTRFNYCNALSYGDEVALLAPTLDKMQKVKANTWIQKYKRQGISSVKLNDSLQAALPVLCTRSDFLAQNDSSKLYQNKHFVFPNRNSTGTFYNVRTICLTRQAQNFTTAKNFVGFYLENDHNKDLNEQMKTLPIAVQTNDFRRYATSTEELLPYFTMVERVLEKLK